MKNDWKNTPPSQCNSSYGLPPKFTLTRVGGNSAGIEADATSTLRNSSSLAGSLLDATAPMSQMTGSSGSRLEVATYKRRPLACSTAIASSISDVTYLATSSFSGVLSATDSSHRIEIRWRARYTREGL